MFRSEERTRLYLWPRHQAKHNRFHTSHAISCLAYHTSNAQKGVGRRSDQDVTVVDVHNLPRDCQIGCTTCTARDAIWFRSCLLPPETLHYTHCIAQSTALSTWHPSWHPVSAEGRWPRYWHCHLVYAGLSSQQQLPQQRTPSSMIYSALEEVLLDCLWFLHYAPMHQRRT